MEGDRPLQRLERLDKEATYLAEHARAFAKRGLATQGGIDALLAIERRLEWLGEVLATAWEGGHG